MNVGSFSGRTNASSSNGLFVGAILERTTRLAKMSNASIIKAQMRNVQPNPTSGIRWTTIIGNMTPPREEPAATRPMAAPRFLRNHVETWIVVSNAQTTIVPKEIVRK